MRRSAKRWLLSASDCGQGGRREKRAPPNPLNPTRSSVVPANRSLIALCFPLRYVVEFSQGCAVCVRGFAPHFRFLRKDRCVRHSQHRKKLLRLAGKKA
jgi:hypothetical protein